MLLGEVYDAAGFKIQSKLQKSGVTMRSMNARVKCLAVMLSSLSLAAPLAAQYGHPLKGSWSGEWWLVKGQNNRILLDFNFTSTGYGNTSLTGILNPGPDQVPMKNLTLTPPDVIKAGQAAIAARDAALAKQSAGGAPPADASKNVAAATSKPATPLAIGATGAAVSALQKKLSDLGFAPGETNGTFGKGTQAAVMAFQKSKNIAADGVVGARTASALGLDTPAAPAAPAATTATRAPAAPLKDNVAIAGDPWLLHFEADAKDDSGKMVHYVVDGKMENLGAAYTRVITGTWKAGNRVGNFKVIRN